VPEIPLATMLPRPAAFPPEFDPASPRYEAHVLASATALAGACPWLGVEANLLPPELRKGSSRVRLIPTIAFAVILVVLAVLLATQNAWADARYLALLQREIAKFEPAARSVDAFDKRIAATRARSQSLDDFRRRAKLDMDSLAEITRLVPPPAWLNSLEMDRQTAQFGGETDQAAPLLERLDKSPLFEKSEFTMPMMRATTGEMFRIRTQRTVPLPGQPAGTPAPARPATPAPAEPPAAQQQPQSNPFVQQGAPRR
jgi:Tfp pilus assembly protein PilN